MKNQAAPRPPTDHPRTRRKPETPDLRMRHGFYSSRAVIAGESEAEYAAFRHSMLTSLQPGDPMECALADQVIQAQWKLKRLWAAETGLHRRHERQHPAPEGQPYSYPEQVAETVAADNAAGGNFHALSQQEVRLTHIFHKALRHLEYRQDSRRKRFPVPEALQAARFKEVAIAPAPRSGVAPPSAADDRPGAGTPPSAAQPAPASPSNGPPGECERHLPAAPAREVPGARTSRQATGPSASSDAASSNFGISRGAEENPPIPQAVPWAAASQVRGNSADPEPPVRRRRVIPFDPHRPTPPPTGIGRPEAEDDKRRAAGHRPSASG